LAKALVGMSELVASSPFGSVRELQARLRRTERRTKLVAAGLAAPLALFLVVIFVLPIFHMLTAAWHDRSIVDSMPRTTAVIHQWDRAGLPDEDIYRAIARDLLDAQAVRGLAVPARRLNQELSGFRTLIFATPRQWPEDEPESYRDTMLDIDPRWGDVEHLVTLQRAARPFTDFYVLYALDLERDLEDRITRQPPDQRLYLTLIGRTLNIALSVTAICLVMGFPIAFLLAHVGGTLRNVLLILVLLPFWTSLLVRTAAWIVVLQSEGIVNTALISLGIIGEPVRMIYNRVGVLIVMSQVLLPFMILPLYAVMSGISHWHMRAALGLGGRPWFAFRRVYLPQTLPGIAAGTLLVFMLSVGYYITPALVGGSADQMLSYFIAFYANETINWGLAAALGTVLMVIVLVLFALYSWLFSLDRVRMR
jgi:putative spermidine/putrescine transport system permease protein